MINFSKNPLKIRKNRIHAPHKPFYANFLGEARTRILFYQTDLIAGLLGLSLPVFSQLVFHQVNSRVREDLKEEVETFDKFLTEEGFSGNSREKKDLVDVYNAFLRYRIPEDDTFLITIIDGHFFNASPKALPAPIDENSVLMKRWQSLQQQEQGEEPTRDPDIGDILYYAKPIPEQGTRQGVFIAVHTTAGEIEEAKNVIWLMGQVSVGTIIIALILSWVAAGKVLAPLRTLAFTARSISETDLNRRIAVRGKGELADLSLSFNQMMDRLQAAFDSQKAFINDAGHELRTPITIIRGNLELLDDDDPQERQETIALVLDELDRMSRMVEELLLLTKSERPDFLNWEAVELGLFAEELFLKAKALAPRNFQLAASATGTILADRQRLTQAIMNLVENAIRHSSEADMIEIGSALEGHLVRLWVRDSGEGIAESDQQRIFERFARGHNCQKNSEGTGLGLSIVRAIAQAHGGWVELVSQIEVGSTFSILLPMKSSL